MEKLLNVWDDFALKVEVRMVVQQQPDDNLHTE